MEHWNNLLNYWGTNFVSLYQPAAVKNKERYKMDKLIILIKSDLCSCFPETLAIAIWLYIIQHIQVGFTVFIGI